MNTREAVVDKRHEAIMDKRIAACNHGVYRDGMLIMRKRLESLVPLKLYETIKEQAGREQRPVSTMIMVLLKEALRARGSE